MVSRGSRMDKDKEENEGKGANDDDGDNLFYIDFI